MPIYEYRCESCGDRFEKLVRRTEEALAAGCPACGDHHLEQQYSTFAARAGSPSGTAPAACEMPSCGSGMCGGGMCGMN